VTEKHVRIWSKNVASLIMILSLITAWASAASHVTSSNRADGSPSPGGVGWQVIVPSPLAGAM
jgi:hypothetical protein